MVGGALEPLAGAETPVVGLDWGSFRAETAPTDTSGLSDRLLTCRGLWPDMAGAALSENKICLEPTAMYAIALRY